MTFFKPGLVKATMLALICAAGLAASNVASASGRHHGGHRHHSGSNIALALGLGALAYSAGRHDNYYAGDYYYPRYRPARAYYYPDYYDHGYYARPVVYYGGYYGRDYHRGHRYDSRRHYSHRGDGHWRHDRDGRRDGHRDGDRRRHRDWRD